MAVRLVFDLGDKVRISPPLWPEHKLNVQPGDLSKFTPNGNGVYGYQNRFIENPIKSAPSQEPSGGVVYFGVGISIPDLEALLRVMGVKSNSRDYAVFIDDISDSKNPGEKGYLVQMRIVSKFALRFMFGALSDSEYDKFPGQKIAIGEALHEFVKKESIRWGMSFTDDDRYGLRGKFGGDGDFEREELAFGFMVENDYNSVYRIWSRAWLVTK